MNTFPILDESTIQTRRGREYIKAQDRSFWLEVAEREGFTRKAEAHFEAMQPPQTASVVLQLAKRNGFLY